VTGRLSEEALAQLETSRIVPSVVESIPRTVLVESVKFPFSGDGGGLVYEHHLGNISLGSEFKIAALNDAEQSELKNYIHLKAGDYLAAHPNIPEAKLEADILAAVEKKFSSASWWAESPVTSVDVDKVEVVLVSGTEVSTATETASEALKGEYQVQKGDTLWKITERQFADQLKDLTPQERNEVLGRLFERVKADSGVLESLNLKSVDNIDKIYAGESINLDGLQNELTQVLEDRGIVEQFQKSAPLSVEADAGVKSVPITVVEKPIPEGTEVVINNERSYTEAAPTKPTVIAEATTTKGFYETAPQHVRDEIRQYFNNPRDFAKAVDNAAYKIDARAYDFFDTLSNTYKSPLGFLGNKTLAEYAELEAKPNAELRAILAKENIKYEAFLEWQDKIKDLEEGIPHSKTDTISKMFEQSVFQDKVSEKNNSYINP